MRKRRAENQQPTSGSCSPGCKYPRARSWQEETRPDVRGKGTALRGRERPAGGETVGAEPEKVAQGALHRPAAKGRERLCLGTVAEASEKDFRSHPFNLIPSRGMRQGRRIRTLALDRRYPANGNVSGFSRVFSGKVTGPPTRCDSNTALIISTVIRPS
jgi:hypothetical protein